MAKKRRVTYKMIAASRKRYNKILKDFLLVRLFDKDAK